MSFDAHVFWPVELVVMGVQHFGFLPCLENLAVGAVLAIEVAGLIRMVGYLMAEPTHNALGAEAVGVAICFVGGYDLVIRIDKYKGIFLNVN